MRKYFFAAQKCCYSFLMAARGLNFMALVAGRNPAAIPTNTSKQSAAAFSHNGISDNYPGSPVRP